MTMGESRVFVLVHGAWHGGWCWAHTAALLRAAGHRVFTPTQTGLGERRHLISKAITIDTFVSDIAEVLVAEELHDVVLVGHSFGGLAVSGVADRMPERLRRLVYLDALIVESGLSAFDGLPPEVVAGRLRAAQESSGGLSLPVPPPEAFGVTGEAESAWLRRRCTPHPLGSYTTPLLLKHPLGNGVPLSYVDCTAPAYPALDGVKARLRAGPGWDWRMFAASHDAMVTAPAALADLLMEIAG
jgi:pimeloyl-ACP methyl ester carboxylesterase